MPNHRDHKAKLLNYAVHFSLLAVAIATFAAVAAWRPRMGIMASGVYGGLHAVLLVVSLRQPQPAGRRMCFVVVGAALCMVNAMLCMRLAPVVGAVAGTSGMAGLLAAASAGGAAVYAGAVSRCFAVPLSPGSWLRIAGGCAGMALATFATGLYSAAGGFGLAASWWVAMSMGLWWQDRGGAVKLAG